MLLKHEFLKLKPRNETLKAMLESENCYSNSVFRLYK